jgi:phosphomannomutase
VTPFTELAPSNVVIFELEGGHRAMLRPSGTEPKLKYYFYATAPAHAQDELGESKKQALDVLERMAQDLTRSNSC